MKAMTWMWFLVSVCIDRGFCLYGCLNKTLKDGFLVGLPTYLEIGYKREALFFSKDETLIFELVHRKGL